MPPKTHKDSSIIKFIWTTKNGLENQENNLTKVLKRLTGANVTLTSKGQYKAFYDIDFSRKPSPTQERYLEDLHKRLRALMARAECKKEKMQWIVKMLSNCPSLKKVKETKSKTRGKASLNPQSPSL